MTITNLQLWNIIITTYLSLLGLKNVSNKITISYTCLFWGSRAPQWGEFQTLQGRPAARCRRCDARSSPYRPSSSLFRALLGTSAWGSLSCSALHLQHTPLSAPYLSLYPEKRKVETYCSNAPYHDIIQTWARAFKLFFKSFFLNGDGLLF